VRCPPCQSGFDVLKLKTELSM